MFFNHLRRKFPLNDLREMCPCHTFQTPATQIFMSPCHLRRHHAKRFNSFRFGACPTTPKAHSCRAHQRQEPCKNLARIIIRPIITPARFVNYRPCQPHATAIVTPEDKRRHPTQSPTPPHPHFPRAGSCGAARGPGAVNWASHSPLPLACSLQLADKKQ